MMMIDGLSQVSIDMGTERHPTGWRFTHAYTDYTNYTDYTRYTVNPGKATGNRILAWLIRRINKRTQPLVQAQSCNPAEYGGKGRHWAGICIKKGEPIISDKLACST